METKVFALSALLTVVVSTHGFFYDDFGDLSEAEIPHHMDGLATRIRREAQGSDRSHHHRRHRPRFTNPPFKHCCGGMNNTDFTTLKKSHRATRDCIEKQENNLTDWERFGNPTKDPFTCERVNKLKNRIYCTEECIMKELGVLRENGSVDIDIAKLYFTKDLTFDWLKEMAEEAVEKCATKKGFRWIKNEDKMTCSSRAIALNHCFWSEIIMTCPAEHQVKSDYCERVKMAFEDTSS